MNLPEQEGQSRGRRILGTVGYLGAWGSIAVLLAPTLIQVKTLLLFIALQLINNPSLRPPSWNTDTLVGVDKCLTFLAVGTWLLVVMYTERYLREGAERGRLLVQAGRAVLTVIIIYGSSAAFLFMFS